MTEDASTTPNYPVPAVIREILEQPLARRTPNGSFIINNGSEYDRFRDIIRVAKAYADGHLIPAPTEEEKLEFKRAVAETLAAGGWVPPSEREKTAAEIDREKTEADIRRLGELLTTARDMIPAPDDDDDDDVKDEPEEQVAYAKGGYISPTARPFGLLPEVTVSRGGISFSDGLPNYFDGTSTIGTATSLEMTDIDGIVYEPRSRVVEALRVVESILAGRKKGSPKGHPIRRDLKIIRRIIEIVEDR